MESTIIYHQGYLKAHLAYNRKRIYINTKVKVAESAVDAKGFVKSSAVENWKNLNEQILLHKERLDKAIALCKFCSYQGWGQKIASLSNVRLKQD